MAAGFVTPWEAAAAPELKLKASGWLGAAASPLQAARSSLL